MVGCCDCGCGCVLVVDLFWIFCSLVVCCVLICGGFGFTGALLLLLFCVFGCACYWFVLFYLLVWIVLRVEGVAAFVFCVLRVIWW